MFAYVISATRSEVREIQKNYQNLARILIELQPVEIYHVFFKKLRLCDIRPLVLEVTKNFTTLDLTQKGDSSNCHHQKNDSTPPDNECTPIYVTKQHD